MEAAYCPEIEGGWARWIVPTLASESPKCLSGLRLIVELLEQDPLLDAVAFGEDEVLAIGETEKRQPRPRDHRTGRGNRRTRAHPDLP